MPAMITATARTEQTMAAHHHRGWVPSGVLSFLWRGYDGGDIVEENLGSVERTLGELMGKRILDVVESY